MIISVDFDGVITEQDCFPEIGTIAPDCKEVMNRLSKAGVTWILNTCRVDEYLMDAVNFCMTHRLPITKANQNLPERIAMYGGDCRKISADVYIDDKNLNGFPGWLYVEKEILMMMGRDSRCK